MTTDFQHELNLRIIAESETNYPEPTTDAQRAALSRSVNDPTITNARKDQELDRISGLLSQLSTEELTAFVATTTDATHGKWDAPPTRIATDAEIRAELEGFEPFRS
jgi:hypothetical protein